MILNNCTTCGRKPEFGGFFHVFAGNYHVVCKCGKTVMANKGNIWQKEVAADMWNRANPQERNLSIETEHINKIAADLAKMKAVVSMFGGNLHIGYPLATTEQERTERFYVQMDVRRYEDELTEFYKKRLKPGVKA